MKNRKEQDPQLRFFAIPKIMHIIRRYRKEIWTILLFTSIDCLCAVIRPVMMRYALNHFVGELTLDGLGSFIVLFMLILIVASIAVFLMMKIALATEMKLDQTLRNDAFRHLQDLSFDYFNQNSVGYIHARVMSDTSRIGELFTWQLLDFTDNALYIVGAFVIMFVINAKLALMVLAVVPVIAVLFAIFEGRVFRLHHEVREINSRITGNFNEGITGAKTIKSLVIERRIENDFRSETSNMWNKSVEAAKTRGMFLAVTNLATSAALAIVLWKGGLIAQSEVGTFSLFMSYAQNLIDPVRMMVEVLAFFVYGKVNIERYSKLMETKSSVSDSPEVIEKYGDNFEPKKENWEPIKGDIEFRDVDFKYPDGDDLILEHFDLKIPFGTNVAIVGETGAGKSTLANLICRFYEPTRGQVLIDGKDARLRSQLWMHSALGYVLQTPHLFSGTVRENLLYGNPDATDEDIYRVLELVSAGSVVEKLDKGLDSYVGEGGDLLSTGEKQLLSFARAILADPRIIVLDEATASVDTITEQRIQAAIDTVIKGRTSIVIAHRLSTIKNADIILVVSDGKIIERGKHEELLALNGHYRNLWERQYAFEAVSSVLGAGKRTRAPLKAGSR